MDLGPLKCFLGFEIARSSKGIFLNQCKYVIAILNDTSLLGAKPVGFPMEQHLKLSATDGIPLDDHSSYHHLIGWLIYLTIMSPNITYLVHIHSQFMHKPLRPHFLAALWLLRYLKGTLSQGILLPSTGSLHLTGYYDFYWANCPMTRRSTSRYCTMLGSSPSLGKQRNTQLSLDLLLKLSITPSHSYVVNWFG